MFKPLTKCCALTALVCAAWASPGYVYVSNISGNTISVVNPANGSVIRSIAAPSGPHGIAVTRDGTTIYVTSQNTNTVSAISTATGATVASVGVGTTPVQIAITPDGAFAYVVNHGSNNVSVIQTASNSVVATVPVGTQPNGVTISPDGGVVYVANVGSGNVSVISTATNSVTGTFAAGSGPTAVAVSPSGTYAYVANQFSGTVTVHSLPAGVVVATVTGVSFPNSLAITPDGGSVFVTNGNSQSVSVIRTSQNQITGNIVTGSLPVSVAVSADGAQAYVANEDAFSLSVIDTASFTLTSTISRVGVYPIGVATVPSSSSGPVCTFTISPGTASFGANGGTGSVSLTAPAGCSWSAASRVSWASVTSAASGSGNATINYSVQPNATTSMQTGSLSIAGQSLSITESGGACAYTLSSTAASLGSSGASGSVTVTAPPGCAWTANSNSSFLSLTSGSSGSGSGRVTYSAAPNVSSSSVTGSLTIAGQTFAVTEDAAATVVSLPFGSIDTPISNGPTIAGAIGITGWALSHSGISSVGIWREAVAGEKSGGFIYLGNAEIVVGARPDVAASFPGYPGNNSGWGFQLLTNTLPSSNGQTALGNGTYNLHVLVTDNAGQVADLGTRSITVDNAASQLPFGTIDTPVQGQTVSGKNYVNFGWAVTPQPNLIPIDGSTITVLIDEQPVGHPVYNNYRADVANIFGGLQNSLGAVGFYSIDTTKLANGIHTISWSVIDNAGKTQGVGSRFFIVQN